MDKFYWLLFSVVGLALIGGCGPVYNSRVVWVGPGAEQEIAQVRYQCLRDTGGEHLVTGPGELGRIGTGRPGEPDPTLFTEYQAKKTPLAVIHYRRLLFIKCMESKGYRLEPVAGGTKEPVEEIPINVTSSNFDEPPSEI
ncbi:MAG: hypothetical protein IH796_10935 [Deltaproteobacteria bacterium]|nr:hypothetical protein [Deltaproteobacteria bacterium]